MSNTTSNEIAEPRVSVTLTGAEYQELIAKQRTLANEVDEGDRINAEAVNEIYEMKRQLYAMTQERDSLLKWKARVLKAIGPEEQPVETSGCVAPPRAQHGRDCPKVQHIGEGYLHAADDDRPYEVDGLVYCGRCHGWLDRSKGTL